MRLSGKLLQCEFFKKEENKIKGKERPLPGKEGRKRTEKKIRGRERKAICGSVLSLQEI